MKTLLLLFPCLALSCLGQTYSSGRPPRPTSNDNTPSVAIESVLVEGREQTLTGPPGSTRSIIVPRDAKRLEINYNVTDLASPRQPHFRYRMEGIDAGWVDGGNRRKTLYFALPPGRYRFEVSAADTNGNWYPVGATLNITTESQSLGLLLTAAIILVIIALAFYFLLFRRERNEAQSEHPR